MKKLALLLVLILITLSCYSQKKKKFTDARDGKKYSTVKIGNQKWMAENLAFKASDGCWAYDNDPNKVEEYGYLYTWDVAMVVCPAGWHLPTEAEWTELIEYLGGEGVAGGKLKECDTIHWDSPNTGATNESGFTALSSSNRYDDGTYHGTGHRGNWWSSTEDSESNALCFSLFSFDAGIYGELNYKEFSFTVRCVKD